MSSNFLKKQREEQRFRHATDYVRESAAGTKKLTTSELSRLNQILTASDTLSWRTEPTMVQIPSGQVHQLSIISNPVEEARKILGNAFDLANNQDIEVAAAYLYLQLIQHHLFQDANRRTAALAVLWLLSSFEKDIDPQELLSFSIGNVREDAEKARITIKLKSLMIP